VQEGGNDKSCAVVFISAPMEKSHQSQSKKNRIRTMIAQKLKSTIVGISNKLVALGLLSETDVKKAIEQSRRERTDFVSYVVNHRLVNSRDIAQVLSEEFCLPRIDLECTKLNPKFIKLIDEELLEKHKALPLFKRGKRLFVAVSVPTNLYALKDIQLHTKIHISPVIAEADKLDKFIKRAINWFYEDKFVVEEDKADDRLVDEKQEEKIGLPEESPIVKFVNLMLFKAIKMGASDLHFEPYEKYCRVRFRIDGVLRGFAKPPVIIYQKLAERIKLMSRLDVTECSLPQKGGFKLRLFANKIIDFRVITCPAFWGENIVMRIIDSSASKLNIDMLGFEEEQKRLYLEALANPYGMVLVTGRTGSGKTVTLYAGINILNNENVNIFTAEDPVEIKLPGVNQVQIDEKTGMTFAELVRIFMAQRADVILVDEIRDVETGKIAIRAANSGHMVMSTLHTNDAPQALTHLLDMGIKPFAIASAVKLVIAQRLCRRLCVFCKTERDVPDWMLMRAGFTKEEIPALKLYGPKQGGCEKCGGSGYKGQIGIYQVMPISEPIKRLILEGGNAVALAELAHHEGVADLRGSGLKKVKDGLTSLEEFERVK